MCKCDELRQLLAAVCKERDELRKERDRQAAELDAMLAILKVNADCDYCKHNGISLPCAEPVCAPCETCTMEKAICCGCGGEKWEWKGANGVGKA